MAEVPRRSAGLGNPTGSHPPAQRARRLLEEARDEVAAFLGRDPGDIVFTSGGTESANLAVLGPAEAARQRAGRGGGPVPRPSSTRPCASRPGRRHDRRRHPRAPRRRRTASSTPTRWRARCRRGCTVRGRDDGQQRDRRGRSRCADVVEAVRRRAPTGLRVHRRGAGRALPRPGRGHRAAPTWCRSARTRSAGPVGVGALAVSGRVVPRSRASTAAGRSASGAAGPRTWRARSGWPRRCGSSAAERATAAPRVAASADRLRDGLLAAVDGAHRTVCPAAGSTCCPGHLHLCRPGRRAGGASGRLSGRQGVCVSGGSSCASGALEPSHVLAAMGVAPGAGGGRRPLHAGVWHHGCRRRPGPCRRAGGGGALRSREL